MGGARWDLAKFLFNQFIELEAKKRNAAPNSLHEVLRKALWKAAYAEAARICDDITPDSGSVSPEPGVPANRTGAAPSKASASAPPVSH